jgi:hypothetical protein
MVGGRLIAQWNRRLLARVESKRIGSRVPVPHSCRVLCGKEPALSEAEGWGF